MISRFFIYHPIAASVISIIIVIAGAVSQQSLPVAKFPPIAPPTVQVQCFYPGASAKVVADTVAQPIEQEVNGVEGMLYISSVSADDGSYTLTVTFDISVDLDMATVLVQNRVAIAEPKLPEEVRRQGIITKKQSTQILQFIAITSPNKTFDALYLSNYATQNLNDDLARIEGVGEVMIFGADDYSMRVWLDPTKLKARNITTEDVLNAIREQNVQVAAGRIGDPPAPQGASYQLSINTLGRLRDVEQFENIIIKTTDGNRYTRVRDVARIELGANSYNIDSTFNSSPSANLAIYQLPGANALDVAEQVKARMDILAERFPEDLEYAIPFDTTRFIDASIKEVYTTLAMAIGLVVLVIFIFLQDWRATIVPCAAIPVSLIGVFAFLGILGFSINMLTLFGIVLAIGIVVDDAIVVVENTTRHLDAGLGRREAAVRAMEEMTGPVIATTLVLLAVFVPTAFMAGITGQLYRQFALTISAAVAISTINALSLSPALCGLLLRPSGEAKSFLLGPFFRLFNRVFDAVTLGYGRVIGASVRVVSLTMLLFAGLVAATGWGFANLPTGFMPIEDQGYAFLNIQLPDAASLGRTQEVMQKIDTLLEDAPGVADWVSISGYSMLSGARGSNSGFVAVIFDPWEERDASLRQEAIVQYLQREFAAIQEGIVFAFLPPPIDGLGNASGFQMQVQDRADAGLAELDSAVNDLLEASRSQSSLAGLNTTFRANAPQLFADIDRTKVKSLDVPLSSVFGTLQAYLGSAYANDFNLSGRTYQVRVQADHPYRQSTSDIEQLEVRNNRGEMIPLGTFVDIQETVGPQVLQRFNMYPTAQVNGQPATGFSSGEALELMEQIAGSRLPASMGFEWTGMSYQEKLVSDGAEITQSPSFILVLSIVLVFLVLAFQYESWTSPAAVIAIVPLAASGVVVMLMVRQMDLNVYTQIGLVLLIALASKNAILIVEFASELRREGKTIREAAQQAATLRFRAILMTAFSSILGFLPLLLSSGAGAASRQAVGNAVVGGMVAATFASLLFVPAFFVLFQGLSERGQKES